MNEIEPFYGWEKYYRSDLDPLSPFFEKEYNFEQFSNDIYGYYIHPSWDEIGSETLYIKILFLDPDHNVAIIELIGEWNDTLHNDVMFLKRDIIDALTQMGIRYFILIGENVFNFHGSDDCYYEEWFEDIEDGWIATIGFRDFIHAEWRKFGIDCYFNFGGALEEIAWRTFKPLALLKHINENIQRRLGM